MKQMAITGGKGGTGKSTFAILLSLKLAREGNKVVLCDADVECPNDHLLLGFEEGDAEPIFQDYPLIDAEKCIRCGKCVDSCRFNALFSLPEKEPQLVKNLCCGCGLCWMICPTEAITPKKEECGQSFSNKHSDNFWLVTGKSFAGVEETGPIVRDSIKRAKEIAREIDADFLLVDTAAGTHCSVINALLDSESAYIVTEPTPLGKHDSKLMIHLLDILEIPYELVLNKAGIADEKIIEDLASSKGKSILYSIPYSEELANAYSKGNLEGLRVL